MNLPTWELFLAGSIPMLKVFGPPIISLVVFYFLKRKLIWLSIPITILADIIFLEKTFLTFPSGRIFVAAFLIPQISVTILISILVIYKLKRTK